MEKSVGRLLAATMATLVIMYVVPFPFYGTFQALGLVELPEGATPAEFLLSVLVIKIGVAVAFVLLFQLAAPGSKGLWWRYAAIWWVMFAAIEIGQAIGPGYSTAEAVAGILAEAVYFPLASAVVARLLGGRSARAST